MRVVVPYTCKRPWPFSTQEIHFLYQESSENLATVYFPTIRGRNIIYRVPITNLHNSIMEYVQAHILEFVEDAKYHDELKGFFVETPIFDVLHLGAVTLGNVVIDVWEKEDSCG